MFPDNQRIKSTLHLGIAVFFMLSAADFMLTWRLVSAANSEVAEINPLASWVLETSGWIGLACYKIALVTVIGLVVRMIASRRNALGVSVIMFGCGAQASVVLTGAMLWGNSSADVDAGLETPTQQIVSGANSIFPPGGFALLSYSSVQQELGLSKSVVTEIEELEQQRRLLRQKLRTENVADGHNFFFELYSRELLLTASLSPQQAKRLQQLSWQVRGELAFLDSDVCAGLKFTDSQLDEVSMILSSLDVTLVAPRDGSAPSIISRVDLQSAKDRLATILNTEQKDRWQVLQGEPFDYSAVVDVSMTP